MNVLGLLAPAFLLATVTSPAASQRAGMIEVGAFAQVSYFEESLGFEQAAGGGGIRLGFFPVRYLELEVEGGFVPTQGRGSTYLSYIPLRARLLFNLPWESIAPFW